MPRDRLGRTLVRWLAAGLTLIVCVVAIPRDRQPLPVRASEPPPVGTAKGPIGWDLYRRLDLVPLLSRGVETRQFSSFDRTGGNADFSHCLRTAPDGCVLADVSGPGEVDSMWFTRDFGDVARTGAIKIELDGRTVVYAPLSVLVTGSLGAPFVFPLVADATRSSGGNSISVPMPFRTSMRIVTDTDPIYYQVTYRVFADAVGVRTFDPRDQALDVVQKLRAAGAADPKSAQPGATTSSRDLQLDRGASTVLADLEGPGAIDSLQLDIPQLRSPAAAADVLRGVRLRLSFDGQPTVDAPLGQFFGSGLGVHRVAALMFAMDASRPGRLAAWWPMPYRSRATIGLVNQAPVAVTAIYSQVTSARDARWADWLGPSQSAGYFRADSHDASTVPGVDHPLLHANGTGKAVGVNATLSGPRSRAYLEGDERVYVDGSRSPQVHGTGTEDFFRGGWYFDHGTFSDPLSGETANEHGTASCPGNLDCTDAYRTLLADAVPFASSIAFGIEHGGTDDVRATYSSTAFWYGLDAPSMRLDDSIAVGSPDSERVHGYSTAGPDRSATLTATYEGNDGTPAPVAAAVRATRDPVRFQLTTSPRNMGIVLRRMSDQREAHQSATVLVDDVVAGVWLQPLGNPDHRWLDDSFLLPAALTAGAGRIRVELVPTGGSPPWSAAQYQALSIEPPDPQASS
jgi:hypothetical protein